MATYALTVSTSALGLGVISGAIVVAERKRTTVTDIYPTSSLYTKKAATNISGIATIQLEADDGSVFHEVKIFDVSGILVYKNTIQMPPQDADIDDLPLNDIITESATKAVAASVTATTQANTATAQAGIATAQAGIATAQAGIATAQAVLTAADRVQTGLDVIAAEAAADAAAADAAAAAASAASIIVATKKFSTYEEQMAYTGNYIDGQKCDVLSYYSLGDGGFIPMYWSASSTAVHNGGTVRKPTAVSGAGRWLAVNPYFVTFAQFGGKKSDTGAGAANFSAFEKACQALGGSTSPTGTKGTLYIQAGTYTIANDEIRTTGGFKIVGDGAGVSILSLTNTFTNDFFNFKDGANVVLENFSIVGEYNDEALPPYGSEPNTSCIDFRFCNNNFISNVSFTRIWGRCINLTSSQNTHLSDFDIECIYNGFQINDDSATLTKDVWITNGTFRGFAVAGFDAESDDSLYLLENVYIDNVTCVGHPLQVSAQGISFTKSTSTGASDFEKHKNIHVSNCRISDCFQASAVRGARGVYYTNIQTNNCTRGFDFGNSNAVHDVFMKDIVINGKGGSTAQGIIIYPGFAATPSSNSNNINIENVVMRDVCASTAALLINAETFNVKNVRIFGDGTASSVAIETNTKANRFTISDCFVSDFTQTAYKINGTSTAKARIYSNTAQGGGVTTSKGIDILCTSSSIDVFDNDATSNVTTPITPNLSQHHDNVGYDNFYGSMTYDAPSIPAGQMVTQLVTCTGSTAGDYASGSFSNLSTGIQITYEAGSNAVLCTISNSNTVAVDMGSGTLRVKVVKK